MKGQMDAICDIAAWRPMVLLVVAALGPQWTPRTALGWQIDRFLSYFAMTAAEATA